MQPVASIPSPSQGVWHLGPLPLRAYALMIILGIIVAVWLGERRWAARGGTPGVVIDVALWAVPFGLVGGRLYHVITDYQRYFGDGKDPVKAFEVWNGGLGIWGAVLLGGVGAWIGCRRRGVSVLALGDAIAPGIALAQAIGRWGNYWNQELYGRPLKAGWALKIDPAHRPRLSDGGLDPKYADIATYHPTFLYESLWCVGVAVLVIWADRRFKLTHGRAFALYVAAYTVGRFWIEWLRIDDAHKILGLRLNDWTSLLVFAGAVAYLYWARELTGPERVTVVDADGGAAPAEPEPKPEPAESEAEPVTAKPEAAKPVAAEAEAVKPEAVKPVVAEAEAAEVEGAEVEPAVAVADGPEPAATEPGEEIPGAEEPEEDPAPESESEEPLEDEDEAEDEAEAAPVDEPVAEATPEPEPEPAAEPAAEEETEAAPAADDPEKAEPEVEVEAEPTAEDEAPGADATKSAEEDEDGPEPKTEPVKDSR